MNTHAETATVPPSQLNPYGFWGDRRLNRSRFVYLSAITIFCALSLSHLGLALASYYQLQAPADVNGVWALPGIWFAFIYLSHHSGRRLNDLNRSRLWTALLMIPLLNVVMFFYLAWHQGDSVTNHYGEPSPEHRLWPKAALFLALHAVLLNLCVSLV